MLAEQKGQQHQHASVVDHPPHVDGALGQPLLVARELVHVLGHQQGLMGCCGLAHGLCTSDSRRQYDFNRAREQFESVLSNETGEAPMKFLQDCAWLACLQLAGQAIRTVLCFIPPRPAD